MRPPPLWGVYVVLVGFVCAMEAPLGRAAAARKGGRKSAGIGGSKAAPWTYDRVALPVLFAFPSCPKVAGFVLGGCRAQRLPGRGCCGWRVRT